MFDKREWLGIAAACVAVMLGAAVVAAELSLGPPKKKCAGGLLQQTSCVHN